MGCGLTIHLSVSDQPHLSPSDNPGGPIVAREWLLTGSLGVNGSNPFTLYMLGIFVCVLSPVGSVLKPTFSKIFSGSLPLECRTIWADVTQIRLSKAVF